MESKEGAISSHFFHEKSKTEPDNYCTYVPLIILSYSLSIMSGLDWKRQINLCISDVRTNGYCARHTHTQPISVEDHYEIMFLFFCP